MEGCDYAKMTEHVHCYCMSCCISETHTGGYEVDEKGKRRPFTRERNVRDMMCCHCGRFKDGRIKFVQTEGHGILRHNIIEVKGEGTK